MAKCYKMGKGVFSWPAQLKNGQMFRNWPWNGQSGNPGICRSFRSLSQKRVVSCPVTVVEKRGRLSWETFLIPADSSNWARGFKIRPNNVFSCQHHPKRPKKCQTMTYMPNTIFSCQTTLKKAKFLEFGQPWITNPGFSSHGYQPGVDVTSFFKNKKQYLFSV